MLKNTKKCCAAKPDTFGFAARHIKGNKKFEKKIGEFPRGWSNVFERFPRGGQIAVTIPQNKLNPIIEVDRNFTFVQVK